MLGSLCSILTPRNRNTLISFLSNSPQSHTTTRNDLHRVRLNILHRFGVHPRLARTSITGVLELAAEVEHALPIENHGTTCPASDFGGSHDSFWVSELVDDGWDETVFLYAMTSVTSRLLQLHLKAEIRILTIDLDHHDRSYIRSRPCPERAYVVDRMKCRQSACLPKRL